MTIIERFMDLFRGLDRAYGTYSMRRTTTKQRDGEKIVGKPATIISPVTPQLWKDHIEGRMGLGIVPILDDSKCYFGAIDIDVYEGLDVKSVFKKIDGEGLPLLPCRTKSGGLHLYLFVKEAVSAGDMRDKLAAFASLLGFGESEIFPKQREVLSERNDVGSWINMPYFGGDKTDRHGWDIQSGEPLSMEDFLTKAEKEWLSEKEFRKFTIAQTKDISDGPPCLQTLLQHGVNEGNRHDFLFSVALYLYKSEPKSWKMLLDEYNRKYCHPVKSPQELLGIQKGILRHDYNYMCNKAPMKQHCNATLCRTREFGIGLTSGTVKPVSITKYNAQPPIWFIDVEGGRRMEVTTGDIQNQSCFQARCMEVLNCMPPLLKPGVWRQLIQELLEKVEVIEAPPESSPRGLLLVHLEKYCVSRTSGRELKEILLGKPYTDENYHYFQMHHFIEYLQRIRFTGFSVSQISSILRDNGGESIKQDIDGKNVNIWRIPNFAVAQMQLKAPDFGEEVF
jgi:hypothetical protein